MRDQIDNYDNELEAVIAARRLGEQIEALALTVFSADELAALSPDHRKVLDMLFKRRLRDAGAELSLADCRSVREQFDQYANRVGDPHALRLATQLR
jgi:hypothetical protein